MSRKNIGVRRVSTRCRTKLQKLIHENRIYENLSPQHCQPGAAHGSVVQVVCLHVEEELVGRTCGNVLGCEMQAPFLGWLVIV